MIIHRKMFAAAAASFNNECLWIVNYVFVVKPLQLDEEPQKPQKFSPSNHLSYTVYGIVLHIQISLIALHVI